MHAFTVCNPYYTSAEFVRNFWSARCQIWANPIDRNFFSINIRGNDGKKEFRSMGFAQIWHLADQKICNSVTVFKANPSFKDLMLLNTLQSIRGTHDLPSDSERNWNISPQGSYVSLVCWVWLWWLRPHSEVPLIGWNPKSCISSL